MSRTPGTPLLSVHAAQAIYDRIKLFDLDIDKRERIVMTATASIAREVTTIKDTITERNKLAKELGELAPDDFSPGVIVGGAPPIMRQNRYIRRDPYQYVGEHGEFRTQPAPADDF